MADANTLTFDEIATLVSRLTYKPIAKLAEGPLPDGEGRCRVCEALSSSIEGPAKGLMAWHSFVTVGEPAKILKAAVTAMGPQAKREWEAVTGAAVHGRCCTIYALARLELERRGTDGG